MILNKQQEGGVIVAANPGFYELRFCISGKPVNIPMIISSAVKAPVIAFQNRRRYPRSDHARQSLTCRRRNYKFVDAGRRDPRQ